MILFWIYLAFGLQYCLLYILLLVLFFVYLFICTFILLTRILSHLCYLAAFIYYLLFATSPPTYVLVSYCWGVGLAWPAPSAGGGLLHQPFTGLKHNDLLHQTAHKGSFLRWNTPSGAGGRPLGLENAALWQDTKLQDKIPQRYTHSSHKLAYQIHPKREGTPWI